MPNEAGEWRRRGPFLAALALAALVGVVGAVLVAPPALTSRLPVQLPFGVGAPNDQENPRATPTPGAAASPSPAAAVLSAAADGNEGTGGATNSTGLSLPPIHKLLLNKALGRRPGAFVLDASTGEVLVARDARRARAPASLVKLVVCAAALLTLDNAEEGRLRTRVVVGRSPSEIVLVGGGDSSLTLARPRSGSYPRFASLAELADATAVTLRGRARSRIVVRVDDSLFTGAAVSGAWEPTYVGSGVVAPISALMVDQGRVRSKGHPRARDPALSAGRHFARLLARAGVDVRGTVTRTTARAEAEVLASVSSPPVPTLVEVVLSTSDNDLAESLARLVARAEGLPASFAGAQEALPTVLGDLGLDTASLRLLDGSGLARGSRMSPQLVGRLLEVSTRDARLRPIATGLPVAGFSGTLADRFDSSSTDDHAGLVRAKTATLSGVAGLAGFAPSPSGTVVAFVLLADRVPKTKGPQARRLLDRLAVQLVPEG